MNKQLAIGDLIRLSRSRRIYALEDMFSLSSRNRAAAQTTSIARGSVCVYLGESGPDDDGEMWQVVLCPGTDTIGAAWLDVNGQKFYDIVCHATF